MRTPLTIAEARRRVDELLAGRDIAADADTLPGAELVVFEDDNEVFRAALARQARTDDEDETVIWVRPIGPAVIDEATKLPAFDPAVVRRRALQVQAAWTEERQLVLELATGQRAIIQPAESDQLWNLQDFDTWTMTLTDEALLEIEALEHD